MDHIRHFLTGFDKEQALSSFFILFALIDIVGNVGIIINLRKQVGCIHAKNTTIAAGVIMFTFLFTGTFVLDLFHIDLDSFAIAGSIIIFLLGLEMVLNVSVFKVDANPEAASIIPLAFPILAGTGTLTALLTLKAEYQTINIILGILPNLVLIYIFLKYSEWIERKLGPVGVSIVHKVMGLMLVAIAVKLFKTHLLLSA